MAEARTVTGHTVVGVTVVLDGVKFGDYVRKGEKLPENLADGEVARLERLGAFEEERGADLTAQGARRAFAQVPDFVGPVAAPVSGARTDMLAALPPQITLAANPEPEGADVPMLGDVGDKPAPARPAPVAKR